MLAAPRFVEQTLSGIAAVAVSVEGPGHAAQDRSCEDASGTLLLDGRALLVMADGLGSAPRGGEGAALAVEAALHAGGEASADGLAEPGEIVQGMAEAARSALEMSGTDPRLLACTLIACVGDGRTLATAHIGDGAVVAGADDGWMVISAPGDTEYVNEVQHLGQTGWRNALRIAIAEPVGRFAAFTDGLQRAALRRSAGGWEAFAGFLDPLFEHAAYVSDLAVLEQDLSGLLAGRRLSEHSEDDKSIGLVLFERSRD